MPKQKRPKTDTPVDDDMIRLSDFVSTEVTIEIKNNTTNTEVKHSELVQLLELLEKGMVLSLPARSCSKGHNLTLKVRAVTPDQKVYKFESTARVEEVEPHDGYDTARIAISFLQFDESLWQNFQQSFGSRQAEIENFLKAARGY